jgi:hypothetical protein
MPDHQEQVQKGPQRKPDRLVAFEDLQWFDCTVERVGPGEDRTIWVNLTDTGGTFERVWFVALSFISQEILATALVAVQTGMLCQVALTGTSDQSEIYRMHAIAARGK